MFMKKKCIYERIFAKAMVLQDLFEHYTANPDDKVMKKIIEEQIGELITLARKLYFSFVLNIEADDNDED